MIGKLKGTLTSLDGTVGLIETQSGVSYDLFLPSQVLSSFHVGDTIDVFTYLQVREDALVLFGFVSKDQLRFFKLLLGVSGVGPKTAFTVISHTVTDELLEAVRKNNVDYFTRIPGLGKKTSMKIILELSQKIKSDFKFTAGVISDKDKTVIEALIALGYKSQDAKQILNKVPQNLSVEEKIQYVLRLTVSKK